MGNPFAPKSVSSRVKKSDKSNVIGTAEIKVTKSEPVQEEKLEAPEGTVAEILDWVGEDVEKAKVALEAEKAGKKRKSLIEELEALIEGQ
jgi:hypothetical protein